MRPISNLNSVSVKNYVPGSDTLAVIRELKKLGILKSVTKAKGRSKPKMIEDIKQPSDMVGYTRTLGGLSPQMRNISPIQQIQPGMTQQQIEDIQRVNAARFAALEGEVQQHRSETQQTIGGLVGAASQRFSQIGSALSEIVNPQTERFRGSTFPAQQQSDEPVDPFAYARGGRVPREFWLPETNDVPMDQTLNEGGPEATPEFATTLYPTEETGNIGIPTAPPNLQPREKIGGKKITRDKQAVSNDLELGKIPTMKNSFGAVEDYYIALTDLGFGERDASLNSKSKILDGINNILEEILKGEGKL